MEIILSNASDRPIYEQITSQIKAMIMSGELQAGEAPPPIRSMAKSPHPSVLTAQKANDKLQADGLIETTVGKGWFVAAREQGFFLEREQKNI